MAKDSWKKRATTQFVDIPLHKGPVIPPKKPPRRQMPNPSVLRLANHKPN